MATITVIGAGGTGVAMSAILSAQGHSVCLSDTANQGILDGAIRASVLHTKGTFVCEGKPAMITSDIKDAVLRSDIIVCCTVSNRDSEIAHTIAPWLGPQHSILLGAGNGGSIIYHRILDAYGKGEVLVAETAGNFFPARATGDGETTIGLPLSPKGVTAFPPARTEEAVQRFAEVWPLTACSSMFEALFNGPNLICHSAGCVLNVSSIARSKGKFNLFTDGLSEELLNVTDALWQEKALVYAAMECTPSPAPRKMLAGVMDLQNPDYCYFRQMSGPGSLDHRYITEDVPNLTCFFLSIARAVGVKVPLFEGVVGLLSAAAGRDFYAEGRTLENLGLDHLNREQLIAFFAGKS